MSTDIPPIYANLRKITCQKLYKFLTESGEPIDDKQIKTWCVQIENSCFSKVFEVTSLVSTIYYESLISSEFVTHYDNIVVNTLQHFTEENTKFIISQIIAGKIDPTKFAKYSLDQLNKSISDKIALENLNSADQIEIKHKLSTFYKCHKCGQPCSAKPIHTSGGDEATKVFLKCEPCGWEHKQR